MTQKDIADIFSALNDAGVRYLVVGGLAVVAHGYLRYTADVDLIISLDPENVRKALEVFKSFGYRPRAPVPIEDFADPLKRKEWQETKGLKGFSLLSPNRQMTEVDIFIDDPLGFEEAASRAIHFRYTPSVMLTVVSLRDLVKLKRDANRPKDNIDLEYLKKLYPDDV